MLEAIDGRDKYSAWEWAAPRFDPNSAVCKPANDPRSKRVQADRQENSEGTGGQAACPKEDALTIYQSWKALYIEATRNSWVSPRSDERLLTTRVRDGKKRAFLEISEAFQACEPHQRARIKAQGTSQRFDRERHFGKVVEYRHELPFILVLEPHSRGYGLDWKLCAIPYKDDLWYKRFVVNTAPRDWMASKMRTAYSPVCDREYMLRRMIDFFAMRRLYTTPIDGASIASIIDWKNAYYDGERHGHKYLELPILRPQGWEEYLKSLGYTYWCHATDPRHLSSILNSQVLLRSKTALGGRGKLGEDGDAVFAFKDSKSIHYIHDVYSTGTEIFGDNMFWTVNLQLMAPAGEGGFTPWLFGCEKTIRLYRPKGHSYHEVKDLLSGCSTDEPCAIADL